MGVAIPKDDWTPARIASHREWRSKMYSTQPAPKPDPLVQRALTVANAPEPSLLDQRVAQLEAMVSDLRAQMLQTKQILRARQEADQEPEEPRFKITDIIRIVAKYYGTSVTDIRSSRRTFRLTRPRHVAMYLCRHKTLRSLPEIGRHLGGRDHTTVLHGVRKIEAKMLSDLDLCREVAELEALLG